MTKTKSLLTVGVLLLASFVAVTASRAGSGGTLVNYLTMNKVTALPGTVLSPGSYVFEVVNGHVDIVRVTNRLTNRTVYMGFTNPIERPAGMSNSSTLAFGEAKPGEPVPITAWFPLGSRQGHEFRRR